MTKKWYASKTLWINLIAVGAILAQYTTGNEVIDAEAQTLILALINLIVRIYTGKPLGK